MSKNELRNELASLKEKDKKSKKSDPGDKYEKLSRNELEKAIEKELGHKLDNKYDKMSKKELRNELASLKAKEEKSKESEGLQSQEQYSQKDSEKKDGGQINQTGSPTINTAKSKEQLKAELEQYRKELKAINISRSQLQQDLLGLKNGQKQVDIIGKSFKSMDYAFAALTGGTLGIAEKVSKDLNFNNAEKMAQLNPIEPLRKAGEKFVNVVRGIDATVGNIKNPASLSSYIVNLKVDDYKKFNQALYQFEKARLDYMNDMHNKVNELSGSFKGVLSSD
jgi:hypothetical protein